MTKREEQILEIIKTLTEKQGQPPTLREVGEVMGITRERVRQLVKPMKAAGLLLLTKTGLTLPGTASRAEVRETSLLDLICSLNGPGKVPPTYTDLKLLGVTSDGINELKDRGLIHKSKWLTPINQKKFTRVDYFWSRIDVRGPDDCWLWRMGTNPATGYGHHTRVFGETMPHRAAFALATNTVIPELNAEGKRIHICHTCDVRLCCNPAHLYLGDGILNARDRDERGRSNIAAQGHCKRKLSDEQVRSIRALRAQGKGALRIRRELNLNVSFNILQQLLAGKTYKDVV
jgi:hypothetical protein